LAFFKKNQNTEKTEGTGSILEYLHDVVYILALILVLFTFCMRVVIVSGSSMFSTLVDGDYLLLINRPLCGELEQGDIVVASMERFKDGEPIVKRVVATEGQTVDIDFRAGIVYVDGVALKEDYIYTPTHMSEGMEFPLVVEEGCLFLMGDNRMDSRDSRAPEIGLVDEREILGRAVFLLMPGTGRGEYTVEKDLGRIGGLN
jgi:signal peptidase I